MASYAKHTPGTWTVDARSATGAHGYGHKARPLSFSVVPTAARHQAICHLAVRANGDNVEQMKAYAHLIAAAPDMLDALQRGVAILKDGATILQLEAWAAYACAAIAQATEGQS